jgi:hypothetical protein
METERWVRSLAWTIIVLSPWWNTYVVILFVKRKLSGKNSDPYSWLIMVTKITPHPLSNGSFIKIVYTSFLPFSPNCIHLTLIFPLSSFVFPTQFFTKSPHMATTGKGGGGLSAVYCILQLTPLSLIGVLKPSEVGTGTGSLVRAPSGSSCHTGSTIGLWYKSGGFLLKTEERGFMPKQRTKLPTKPTNITWYSLR